MLNNACVFLFLTEQCNLSCSHCYVSSGPSPSVAMPFDAVTKVLDVFGSNGIGDFRFIGGEPMVHPQFRRIVDETISRGYRARLVTNGKRLARNPEARDLLAKLDMCWVSAYGTTPKRHAAIAGKGSLPLLELEQWVSERDREGFPVGLSILICPGDSHHIVELLDHLAATGIRRIRFIPLEPDGRAHSMSADFSEWPAELGEIYESLREALGNYEFESVSMNDPFDLDDKVSGPSSCLLHSRRMWTVTPSGDIYSCCFNVFQPEHRICNIGDLGVQNLQALDTPQHLLASQCRIFNQNYWQSADAKRVACPLLALNLVQKTGRQHHEI